MSIRRCLVLLLCLALAAPARATWSLILVDTATGEIGVASATCLEGFNLKKFTPVLLVGKGAAVAQSQVDMNGANRKKIWNAILAGLTPAEILDLAKAGDLLKCSRQYGVVVMDPPAAKGFTGACAAAAKKHITGTVGTITYAIQGNILAGPPVFGAIEAAVMQTEGLLSDRLMAAMQAAREYGGDGRCSCSENDPTGCGAPPVGGFEKSAHVGYLIVGRIGDKDGICNAAVGCANGEYWLDLNVIGGVSAPDPVDTLQDLYDDFRQRIVGLPDGVASLAQVSEPSVPGDGKSTRDLMLTLLDADGGPVGHGGHAIAFGHAPGSAGLAKRKGVIDHGDGTYTLRIQAGQGEGVDLYAIRVAGGGGRRVTLFPYPALEHLPVGSGRRARGTR